MDEMRIAKLEKVRIGGCDQWILQRSDNRELPILLFVHGGPGTSQMTLNKRNTRGLEEYFLIVDWDQRGAGKSYDAIKDVQRMNINQFVEDAKELTLYLLNTYGKKRLVLIGHSWGTAVGALTAATYPELYHCYVGISQIANMTEGEGASYRWTLARAKEQNDRGAIRALEEMGTPPYKEDWRANTVTQRRYLGKFGGEYRGSRSGAFGPVIRNLIFSREYSVRDRFNFFRGILGSMRLLWPELMKVNLFESVPEINIPVFFMEGRFDYEAPSELAARYFSVLQAPSKELIWFENSAHLPNTEERDLFNRTLVEKVLPLTH